MLGADEAMAALRARVAAIELKLARLSADLVEAADLPRILLVEAEFEQARLAAERNWTAGLLAELESGELAWPDLAELPPPPE